MCRVYITNMRGFWVISMRRVCSPVFVGTFMCVVFFKLIKFPLTETAGSATNYQPDSKDPEYTVDRIMRHVGKGTNIR